MKSRVLAIAALAIVAAGAVWAVHHHDSQQEQVRTLTALCQSYLAQEAQLPSVSAYHRLLAITAPASEARETVRWLYAQDQHATKSLSVTRATARLSQVTIHGSPARTVSSHVRIARWFSPHGTSLILASATFHLTAGLHPQLTAVSINTNESLPSNGPDPLNPDIWNLVPAGPLPHGD